LKKGYHHLYLYYNNWLWLFFVGVDSEVFDKIKGSYKIHGSTSKKSSKKSDAEEDEEDQEVAEKTPKKKAKGTPKKGKIKYIII